MRRVNSLYTHQFLTARLLSYRIVS